MALYGIELTNNAEFNEWTLYNWEESWMAAEWPKPQFSDEMKLWFGSDQDPTNPIVPTLSTIEEV